MKYKQGDILTINSDHEHFELMRSLMDNYVRVGNCINVLKTKGIIKEFNDIRNDWTDAILMIYQNLKDYRYSLGTLKANTVPYETTLKIIITGIIK